MVRQLLGITTAVLVALGTTGCGSPFLHPAASASTSDPGLVGEWATVQPMEIRASIATPRSGSAGTGYTVALTVHDHGEFKTAMSMDLVLTDIDEGRYMDLSLSRPERDKLVGTYGFLVVPVHQVMKVTREGDTLTVWPFRGDWLEEHAASAAFSHDRVAVGGGDVAMVTAPTERVRELLARCGKDSRAFSDPIVFRRVGRSQ